MKKPRLLKINKNYLLQEIDGTFMVVAIGSAVKKLKGYITLNDTAVCLWKALIKGATKEDLVKTLTENFNVSEELAEKDVDKFIKKLIEKDILE